MQKVLFLQTIDINMSYSREIRRQLVHMSGIVIVPLAMIFGGTMIGSLSFLLSIGIFLYSEYIAKKHEIRKIIKFNKLVSIEDTLHRFINIFERPGNGYRGAFYFYFSSSIVLISFSLDIAVLSITVLAIGDSFATLFGIHGRRKIFFNKNKTWEGALSFFSSSFVFCFLLNPVLALPAAFFGTIIEIMPTKLDDNLTIPVIVAVVLSLIKYLLNLF